MGLIGGFLAKIGLSSPIAPWLLGAAILAGLGVWDWSRIERAEDRAVRAERARAEQALERIVDDAEDMRRSHHSDPATYDERRELRALRLFSTGDSGPP